MLSAKLGSSIVTLAKRRERAASFSMLLVFFLSGPNLLSKFHEPRLASRYWPHPESNHSLPEPMMVWSSSIKRDYLPSSFDILDDIVHALQKIPRKRVPSHKYSTNQAPKTRILPFPQVTTSNAAGQGWAGQSCFSDSISKSWLFLVFPTKNLNHTWDFLCHDR